MTLADAAMPLTAPGRSGPRQPAARTPRPSSRQGMGAMSRRVRVEIDLPARCVTVPAACPVALRPQADINGRRVLALLTAARREQRRGTRTPTAVLGASDRAEHRRDDATTPRRDPSRPALRRAATRRQGGKP